MNKIKIYNDPDYGWTVEESSGYLCPCQNLDDALNHIKLWTGGLMNVKGNHPIFLGGKMSEVKPENIQPTLDTLIALYDSEAALEQIRDLAGMQHRNNAQQGITGLVRYLSKLRDEK